MKTVAVVMFGKDQSLYLRRAIQSSPWPVWYFDGGSSDESRGIAFEAGATVLASPDNITDTATLYRYAGEMTDGDYLFRLSCDDEFAHPALAKHAVETAIDAEDIEGAEVQISEAHGGHTHHAERLWRRDIRWRGRAHEYLIAKTVSFIDLTIIHRRGPWHERPTDIMGVPRMLALDLVEDPACPRWWYYIGKEFADRWRPADAVPFLRQRIRMQMHRPEWIDAHYLLSRCLWMLGQAEEAVELAVKAVALNSNFAEAARWLAFIISPEQKAPWKALAETANNDGVLMVRSNGLPADPVEPFPLPLERQGP
jgi:tetratricopeptide (TPR) repeat protein